MLRLNAFYQNIQPQSILEELIAFSNQGDIFFDEKISCKRLAALPYGNRLYTGPLQALWYKYLNQASSLKTLIILADSKKNHKPIISNECYTEPVLGKKISINQKMVAYFPYATINNIAIAKNWAISDQLPFIRVFTKCSIFPIIVSTSNNNTEIKKSISEIIKKEKTVWIISLSNHESTISPKQNINGKKGLINQLASHETNNMELLYQVAKEHNYKLQLVLYNNTEPDKKNMIKSHYCLVW